MAGTVLALDIGSNSVGSMWFDRSTGKIVTGVSVFPAGVKEADDKRGEPKNAQRRKDRRTRITLARRSKRKRELRLKLIEVGLLPADEEAFRRLLDEADPWELRRKGLDHALTPYEFGRVLLHLAQRRGALGLKIDDPAEGQDVEREAGVQDDGKVKQSIGEVRQKMLERKARTFGEFIAMVRAERVHPITTEDRRKPTDRKGPRVWRTPVRNKAASYEHCADRAMIRHEFAKLWEAQQRFGGALSALLTDELRRTLDDESGDSDWRHRGLLFGQRRQSWDLGTLGRCTLEPTERCVPHADMYASRYRVVETVNALRVIPRNEPARPLTPDERTKILEYLSGPLGTLPARTVKDKVHPERPKTTVSVSDLRTLMGWGRAGKTAEFRFNIENDEDREINTDWFSREVVHGAVGTEAWNAMPQRLREGINRALLRFDPDQEEDTAKFREGLRSWAGLGEAKTEALIAAWQRRPRPDAKRLNLSRRAVRNLLALMDRPEPWPDERSPSGYRWLTEIEARKLIAEDTDFHDATTGTVLDDQTRLRYATGARGLSARDRHYLRRHPDDLPPAPMLSNPVVRKAIHEVRRHIVEYIRLFGRKPDEIFIELAREARMGAKESDRLLRQNRLRSRIRKDIIEHFNLSSRTSTQQREACVRVILCAQQGGVCPLCGQGGLTEKAAARRRDPPGAAARGGEGGRARAERAGHGPGRAGGARAAAGQRGIAGGAGGRAGEHAGADGLRGPPGAGGVPVGGGPADGADGPAEADQRGGAGGAGADAGPAGAGAGAGPGGDGGEDHQPADAADAQPRGTAGPRGR
jgi:CRISPR-associated endonuclease Csn1